MPWKETCTHRHLKGYYTKKDLCMYYGISRPGDKWIERYHNHGLEGLYDRSRRPHRHPDATAPEVAERIVQMKLAHQSFGPKKVMDRLRVLEPDKPWPADSTGRHPQAKRPGTAKTQAPPRPPAPACPGERPGAELELQGRLPARQRPTLLPPDPYRQPQPLHLAVPGSEPHDHRCRQRVGVSSVRPAARRTDNGAPFASLAAGGLRLSTWWVRLGIRPERIRPATPSENGRPHASLAQRTNPAASSFAAQQRATALSVQSVRTKPLGA